MILIISNDDDISTQKVCKWLDYYREKYILITETNRISELSIINLIENNIRIRVNESEFNLLEVNKVWYRRGKFSFTDKIVFTQHDFLYESLAQEWNVINDFLMDSLNQSQFFNKKPNKLITLKEANKFGLITPLSLITSKKEDLFLHFKNKRIISKPVNEVINYSNEINIYSSLSIEINKDFLPNEFPLSFFQELIEKIFEIRIFYFQGVFFASAIFSQNDKQTEIDNRNYNYQKPNKQMPYKLPIEIKEKIENLMQSLSLTSGSIDLILGTDRKYYFLEINPVGQFDNLSVSCLYNIEKVIAKSLIDSK
jgi:ATP-GRASP peptide maturase of grasp-with-spasm system